MSDLFRSSDDVRRVRDATDIVRLVGEHVSLRPKGREYVGLCPFHDDHRPSMNVVPAKQIFHCFVCGAGGDALNFVKKFHNMEFREALEYLAEKAGIELTRRRPQPVENGERPGVSRADLVKAGAQAAEFFRAILRHAEHGKVGREVIERRGISPEMVEAFGIGASPDRWDGLLLTVQRLSLDPRAFLEAGLFKTRDSGGEYDAFRNRLMFPIHDQIGRVIAFGARKIKDEDEPKYLNSPETRVFQKSSTLYGLFQAARSIQTRRIAVITEGYTDTIACHQAGITNAVATLGTALTRGHATILRRLCDTVVLLFDGDLAGQKAADRAVEVFFNEDLDVKIATLAGYTDAKDPDELLKREGGREVLERAIAGATDLLEYRYRRLATGLQAAGPAEINRVVKDDLRRLIDLGLMNVEPIRRQLVLRKLTQVTGVDAEAIVRSRPAGRSGPSTTAAAEQPSAPSLSRAVLGPSEHLLGCLLCDGALYSTLDAGRRPLVAPEAFQLPALASVARAVHNAADGGGTPDLASVLALLEDDESQQAAVALHRRTDTETESNVDRLHRHWTECLARAARDAAAAPAVSGASADAKRLAELIELKRRQHAETGGDLRTLPRVRQ